MGFERKAEMVEGLMSLGIKKGDTIYVASDTKRLMLYFALREKNPAETSAFILDDLLDALLDLVGDEGTVVIPTYNWDFCQGAPFDYRMTRSQVGSLGDAALAHSAFRRTKHPFYSCAVAGKGQHELCDSENMDSFGSDSYWSFLLDNNALWVAFGVGLEVCTFVHYVEQSHKDHIPYRFIKTFEAPYINEEGMETICSASMLVRNYDFEAECREQLALLPTRYEIEKTSLDAFGTHISAYSFKRLYEAMEYDILHNACRGIAKFLGQGECYREGADWRPDGQVMHNMVSRLFPICRSITGDGVRETLSVIREYLPEMTIHEIPSGTKVFDWTVPDEWHIRDAYIETADGERVVSFADSNLHVVGYSIPVDKWVDLDELLEYVYVQEDRPTAIPYVTSYYARRFGFCMSKSQRDALVPGKYHMVIDSEIKPGSLTYGELLIPATEEGTDQEIFFSTYDCHPSMANNELSGPVVLTALAQYVRQLPKRRYSYRFIIVPETIGSITYLSQNLEEMKERIVAGFNLSCVGDDRTYSYVESRRASTLADRVAKNVLRFHYPDYVGYSFLDRGSDERQYNAPGVDLPVCAICRSKYGEYPEYHTSDDNLEFVTPEGLIGGFEVHRKIIDALEANQRYRTTVLCEPQLGKRGLYPTISQKGSYDAVRAMTNLIAYCDGESDLVAISDTIGVAMDELIPLTKKLFEEGLLEIAERAN